MGTDADRRGPTTTGTATVLFTDLVGSTELGVRMGEHVADEARRTHDKLLGHAIARHGGMVIKGLGDGLMATFTGAADALAAAVAIQQVVDRHNRRSPAATMSLRIGISGGDLTWEEGDCFGVPVVEASRLCAAATGGQILIADVVRTMARGRGDYVFEPMDLLSEWVAKVATSDNAISVNYAAKMSYRPTIDHARTRARPQTSLNVTRSRSVPRTARPCSRATAATRQSTVPRTDRPARRHRS